METAQDMLECESDSNGTNPARFLIQGHHSAITILMKPVIAVKKAKRVISSAKEKKQKECANDLNDSECQNEILRMAKQMVKERQDMTGLNCIKGVSGKVLVDDKGIKDSWTEYMEKLMNEENEWYHKISAGIKEGPADCIRIAEVRAVLKKMKRHKAPGLSGLVAEMIQATGDTGTQWSLDLCNGIMK